MLIIKHSIISWFHLWELNESILQFPFFNQFMILILLIIKFFFILLLMKFEESFIIPRLNNHHFGFMVRFPSWIKLRFLSFLHNLKVRHEIISIR